MSIKGITRVAKGKVATEQKNKKKSRKSDLPNRYEIVIRQPEMVYELRQLEIGNKDLNSEKQNILVLSDRALLYEPVDKTKAVKSMTGACHGLNQVFVGGRMPFYARTDTDRTIKIGRISEKFNPAKYASIEGHKLTGKNETTHYEEPKSGQAGRMKLWYDVTKIDFEKKPATEEQARSEVGSIPQPVKDLDLKLYEEAERNYLQRYTDEGEPINAVKPDEGVDEIKETDVTESEDENTEEATEEEPTEEKES